MAELEIIRYSKGIQHQGKIHLNRETTTIVPVTDIGGKEVSATIGVTITQWPASNTEYLYQTIMFSYC